MFYDLILTLNWWFDIFLIGVVFLPLTLLTFNKLSDQGYIFSKILGILFVSFFIWFFSSLKILPFAKETILLVIFLSAVVNWVIFQRRKLFFVVKNSFSVFVFEEVIFLIALLFWSGVKGFDPTIHSLEKFMDFGIINSILRADFMPPKDIWMAGENINYYYFGHFYAAVLTKFSGLSPAISYNLMLASLFGFCFAAAFSIGFNLKRSFVVGFLSAYLATLAGNLQTIYAFFQSYSGDKPPAFWTLKPEFNFLGYWYPNATRFIPFTIHEFPLYSFVVSDLHGHVFSLPVVLLAIVVLIQIYHQTRINLLNLILLGFILTVLSITNILDGPIYLLVTAIILLFHGLSNFSRKKALIETGENILIIIFFILLFSLPFWLNFKPFTSGIGFLCPPSFLTNLKIGPFLFEANHCDRSPFWMLAIIYGFFYIVLFGFMIKVKKIIGDNYLVLAFCLAATILILIPEQFYIKDIYPTHYRANTVFKFGYQAFIILSLMSGYMIVSIYNGFKKTIPYILIAIPLIFCFLLVSIYPLFAINSYYNGLKSYHGLNGIKYLEPLYPEDYQAIVWLRSNIKGQPVVLEAHGDSYTDYGRVSANTGLPTVIGWPVHEWLWRGSYDEVGKRASDVKSLYEDNVNKTQELIKKYHIRYIFIGTLERQKYANINEEKFKTLGKAVFQKDQTVIYKIN